jgi:hypothetical protein
MIALQWYVVLSCALNAVAVVYMVGKPRKPVTSGQAAIQVAMLAILVALALTVWAP